MLLFQEDNIWSYDLICELKTSTIAQTLLFIHLFILYNLFILLQCIYTQSLGGIVQW